MNMIAKNDCTKSGSRLWVLLDILCTGWLLVELGAFSIAWTSNPHLTDSLGLIATGAVLGVGAGLITLHEGLANGRFLMPMRVTLTAIGAVFVSISLIVSTVVGIGIM
jgi:hypothetical protein